jgi:hypothetical protein
MRTAVYGAVVTTTWQAALAGAVGTAMGGLGALDDLLDLLPPSLPSPVGSILDRSEDLVGEIVALDRIAAWDRLWVVLATTIEHYPTDVAEDGTEVPDVAFVAGRAPLRARERQLLVMAAAGTAPADARAEHTAAVPDDVDPLADLCRTVAVSAWLAGWTAAATVLAVAD